MQYFTRNYQTGDPNKIYWIGSSVIGMTTTKNTIVDARPNSTGSYFCCNICATESKTVFLVLPVYYVSIVSNSKINERSSGVLVRTPI
jgi:hypothetical protein